MEFVNCGDDKTTYASSFEHIMDELARLDLIIEALVRRSHGPRARDPLDQLRGLVLSESEIAQLLSADHGESDSGREVGAGSQDLVAALRTLEARIEKHRVASLEIGVPLALSRLAELFRLDRFEEQCLVICLAPEIDRKYDKLYAYLHDDATRKWPSIDLVLDLLCGSREEKLRARRVFGSQSPLRKFGLVRVVDQSQEGLLPLIARPLKLDDGIADLLLGTGQLHPRVSSVCELRHPANAPRGVQAPVELERKVRGFVRSYFATAEAPRKSVVFQLHGPYGAGRVALAEAAANELNLPLLVADTERLLADAATSADRLWLLARESLLCPAVLCLENFDHLLAREDGRPAQLKAFLEAVELFSQLTFLLGSEVWQPLGQLKASRFISLKLGIPGTTARLSHWKSQVASVELIDEVDLGALAGKFRFTPGQIRDALTAARDSARWNLCDGEEVSSEGLHSACRAQSNPRLARFARKIEPHYHWEDIVLPPEPRAQLGEICSQARYRHVVFGDWGFERKLSLGKGLSALFSGPPGTGKTMAAEVIAKELGLDLFKIDLSQVVSKYIGETEKNLDRVFTAAENGSAILFFDEADALFGRRSEVRDSHDRYANLEISYLLQKMDEFEGISILATNLRKNIDDAFLRRLQFIVQFPFPDAEYRERIWHTLFPAQAPLGEDLEFAELAQEIQMAGGSIKNIGLAAAFYAADDGGVIHMPHLVQAATREYQKLGRDWKKGRMATQESEVS